MTTTELKSIHQHWRAQGYVLVPGLIDPVQAEQLHMICSDILANVHATISVDPMAAGHGATFRVVFPCQPSSS